MDEIPDQKKVCVTGGSSYLGSYLVKDLLNKGYTVHATLRDLGEEVKVGMLKSLPHAESRLVLFQADIYNPTEFAPAIRGCRTVVHVATPLQHDARSSQKFSFRTPTKMSISSESSQEIMNEDSLDISENLIDQGNNYYVHDDTTYPVLKAVDDELCRTDESLDEAFRNLIAEFNAMAASFLRSGRVGEHFIAQDARNRLLRLSLRAQRGETRSRVNAALLDLEARNLHRSA